MQKMRINCYDSENIGGYFWSHIYELCVCVCVDVYKEL